MSDHSQTGETRSAYLNSPNQNSKGESVTKINNASPLVDAGIPERVIVKSKT